MKNNVILAEKIKNRAIEIDIIRGICIFLMILDHFFYDLIAIMPSITNFPNVNGSSYEVYLFAFSYCFLKSSICSGLRIYQLMVLLLGLLSNILAIAVAQLPPPNTATRLT